MADEINRTEGELMTLQCPHIESTRFLCDRAASYQIDGVVYCPIHARRLMGLLSDAQEGR